MRNLKTLLVLLAGLFALAACSGTTDTTDGSISSLPPEEDVSAAAADVQAELTALAAEIESSEAADDIRPAWSSVQMEITSALATFTADGDVDTEALQTAFDEFETQLDAHGDEVGDDLRESWLEVRQQVEQLFG
jgi:ABC-type glycerol-3-phosphate transport system substrate-binding protein